MKTFELSEELIMALHIEVSENTLKQRIENEVPELFKSKREVGKWYKGYYYLICYTGNDKCYGFDLSSHEWTGSVDHTESMHKNGGYTPATDEEVQSSLIAEAKKRGFKEGVIIERWAGFSGFTDATTIIDKNIYPSSDEFSTNSDDVLMLHGYEIFRKGKWATLIEEPVKELTHAELEKIVGCKIKIVNP